MLIWVAYLVYCCTCCGDVLIYIVLEVCTAPRLALKPWPNQVQCLNLGLEAQMMFRSELGSSLDQMMAFKRYIQYFKLSWVILFSQRELSIAAHILWFWHCQILEMNDINLIFSGIFVAAAWDNTMQTCHLISLHQSSNDKLTPDILKASLNNAFTNYWHLCIGRNMY